MFKRDARDKVRQMGGIMASSEPLIQEVARFGNGGDIRKRSMLELMFQPPVTLNTVPGIKRTQSRGGPPYATAVDPQRTFMGVQLPDWIKTDSNIKNNMPNYNILGNPGGANINLLPTVAETGDTFTESLEKVDPESDSIEGKAKKGLINFGNYVQENPTEAASLLALSVVPGAGIVYKGMTYTPKMFGALSKILFGTPLRRAATISTAAGTAYVNQDSINEFLKEGGLGRLYESSIEQAKNLPENIAKGKKALDESLGIKGPDAKRSQDPGQLGLKGPDAKANLTPSNEVAEIIKKAQATTKDGPQYPEQLGDNLKTLDPNRRAKPESLPGTADRPGTLGVTADESAEFEGKSVNEKIKSGEGNLGDAQKLVNKVINNGVGTKGLMKQTIDEFMSNVEEYKGMDRGLAIAKIGFAMAAGQSPNAITNIAKALSDGADMFIKDEAQRDAWNRQVNLAAVKYGMGEVSKARTQARADARDFANFVVGKGGYTDLNGVFHKEGKTVSLSMTERLKNAGQMQNLESLTAMKEQSEVYTAQMEEKIAELELLTTLKGGPKVFEKGVEVSQMNTMKNDYVDYVSQAEDATRAEYLFKYVRSLVNTPETGKFTRGIIGFGGEKGSQILTLFGIDSKKTWTTKKKAENAVLAAMGDMTSVVLGKTQSANSISDRDVLFQIVRPYMGNLIEQDGDGNFKLNLTAKDVVLDQIDMAISKLTEAKIQSLKTADGIYESFAYIPQVKGTTGGAKEYVGQLAVDRRKFFGPIGQAEKDRAFEYDVIYDGENVTGLQLKS